MHTTKEQFISEDVGDICSPNPKTTLQNAFLFPVATACIFFSSYQLTINALEPLGDVVLGLNRKGAPSCVYARQREDDGNHRQRYQRRVLLNISHKRTSPTFSYCFLLIVIVALNRF